MENEIEMALNIADDFEGDSHEVLLTHVPSDIDKDALANQLEKRDLVIQELKNIRPSGWFVVAKDYVTIAEHIKRAEKPRRKTMAEIDAEIVDPD